jgi:hypothetical protein
MLGNEPENLDTPTTLLPPEAFSHRKKISQSADMWTLGCTAYDILGERPLFETWVGDLDGAIREMVSTLGLLPTRWWDKGDMTSLENLPLSMLT